MDITTKKPSKLVPSFINDLIKSLKIENIKIQLLWTASLNSQYYYSDFDLYSDISKIKDLTTVYKNLNRIFELKDNNVYFKEFTQRHPYITKSDLTKAISLLTGNNVIIDANDLPKNIVKLLKSDETTNMYFEQKKYKEATGVMINFIFEKFLSDMSKQDDKYNELFIDATNNNVLFLKFILKQKNVRDPKEKKMKKVGIVQFEIADPKTAEKKAFLRPKQGAGGRAQDKLGLQP